MNPALDTVRALPLVALLLTTLTGSALARGSPAAYLDRPADWYRSDGAARVAAHVLSHQAPSGAWPKNVDTTAAPYTGSPRDLHGTFDNGATTDELRLLARMVQATGEPRYQAAFLKGFDHILQAQYPTGGWPQSFPPGPKYHRHITFNDGSMVRLMEFLREAASAARYAFLDAPRRRAAREAFDRGVRGILRCQVVVDGRPTAWCAQHDEKDYSPRPGRSYELVSLSGAETVGIVRLLMSLEEPAPEVIRAIEGAVAWFRAARLDGLRVETRDDPRAPKGKDRVVVKDPAAGPLWARFHEIGTNRPIFCDRDGVAKYDLAAIGHERRNGYAWLGAWPRDLLAKDYPAWKKKLAH